MQCLKESVKEYVDGGSVLDFLALQTAVYPPPEEGQVFSHVVLHERTQIGPIYGL